MAFLANTEASLTGGCHCSAIRYTIAVPALEARPLAPGALPTPINKAGDTIPTRFPLIELDHCESCRRSCGGPVQCWLVFPFAWVEFELQPRAAEEGAASFARAFEAGDLVRYSCADVANPSAETVEATYLGHYVSSKNTHRCFCARCGTTLTFHYGGDKGPQWTLGPIVDIGVGTLDRESLEGVRPERHGWWTDGVGWVKELLREGDGHALIRHPTGRVGLKLEKGE